MTTNKHTPGPYNFDQVDCMDPESPIYAKKEDKGETYDVIIAQINQREVNHIESVANAHLIAAAPEMLEALESIVNSFHESVKTEDTLNEFPSLQTCINAIAKAKGETQ